MSGSVKTIRRRLREAGRDRRGAVAVAFAISATALLGMAALATDAGVWLMARRNAQNAADAAAFGGATALLQRTDAITAGTRVLNRNGFVTNERTSLSVELGNWNGTDFTASRPGTPEPDAVRAQVNQYQSMGLSNLIGGTPPQAWGGAVAALQVLGVPCTLSLTDPTIISGSNVTTTPGCIIASNAAGRNSIWVRSTGAQTTLEAEALVAAGGCRGCYDSDGTPIDGVNYIRGGTTRNPYENVDSYVNNWLGSGPVPSNCVTQHWADTGRYVDADGRTVPRSQAVARQFNLDYARNDNNTVGPRMICERVELRGSVTPDTLVLTPGVYIFYGQGGGASSGDLSATAGASIICPTCQPGGAGVTLIFTGNSSSNVATLDLSGSGSFRLNAPRGDGTNPLDGVLIYRDDWATTDNIKLTGNSESSIFGAIYAPTSSVELVGTSELVNTTILDPITNEPVGCIAVVAAGIVLNGDSELDIRGCRQVGTTLGQVLVVRLVQ